MRKFFLQANDQQDLVDWVNALNKATKITVRHTHTQCAQINTICRFSFMTWRDYYLLCRNE